MKKAIFVFTLAVVSAFAVVNFGTSAESPAFSESFQASKAQKGGPSGVYQFDRNHSFIGFKINHMGLIEVPGFFRDFTGTVNYNADDVTKSSVTFTAKASSIDTGVGARDNHLRTADFFDVEKFPELTFKSTKVEKNGDSMIISGDLTMHGVTKAMTFPFRIAGWLPEGPKNGAKMGIQAETTLNRRDFGINYGNNLPSGIPAIGDEVKVVLQIEAGAEKPTPAK